MATDRPWPLFSFSVGEPVNWRDAGTASAYGPCQTSDVASSPDDEFRHTGMTRGSSADSRSYWPWGERPVPKTLTSLIYLERATKSVSPPRLSQRTKTRQNLPCLHVHWPASGSNDRYERTKKKRTHTCKHETVNEEGLQRKRDGENSWQVSKVGEGGKESATRSSRRNVRADCNNLTPKRHLKN